MLKPHNPLPPLYHFTICLQSFRRSKPRQGLKNAKVFSETKTGHGYDFQKVNISIFYCLLNRLLQLTFDIKKQLHINNGKVMTANTKIKKFYFPKEVK